MSVSKQQYSSHPEDDRFLSRSYSSKDEFVREYKKFYYGKAKAKELYLLVLTKLQKAVLEGNIGTFKRFGKLIDYISDIESQATLKTYYNDPDNPIKTTNLVILACKHNRAEILRYIFGNTRILENVSINGGKDVLASDDKDETCHDAFYYAILSGNVELLDTLINKWPGNYFASRAEELDEVLSRAYEELKLKNVSLLEGMEVFVEDKLINLRFFSERSGPVRISVKDSINNIKERIDLVLDKIGFLKSEYSNVGKVDEKFLFVARFIAQNIHVLKRQIKSTYDRLPWEEIEFCLVAFVSSHVKQQDINIFYRAILNKNKILDYLGNFAKKLADERNVIKTVDIGKLADLPKSKRDDVVAEIISKDPQFEDMYNDYQRIRDIHSLEKISNYLNLALSANPKEREGQLIIIRTLQVIGEYLKNTLESPKLSNTTSELILLSLPKNTRKVIIDLRNSLSHAYSLSKRTEIEENTDANFFIGVQNDTKRIDDVITDIHYNNKIKMIRILLQNIMDSQSFDEMKDIAEVLRNLELDEMTSVDFKMMEHENLEKLVQELSDVITDKTDYEKKRFSKINDVIDSVKTKSQNIRTDYALIFSLLKSFSVYLNDNNIDHNGIRGMKFLSKTALANMKPKIESHSLKQIIELSMDISYSARPRMQNENLDRVDRLTFDIFNIAEFGIGDIKWIEKLRRKLYEKSSFIPALKQKKIRVITEDEYNKQLIQKLSELKDILQNGGVRDKLIEKLPSYKSDKKLQAVVEMLVLDIMSILGRSEKHLENNLLFLDDNTPLLTGKCLRNHLAHGNTLLDVLLSDPSVAVILNAEKLVSENVVKSKKKVGKLVIDDPSKLKDKYDESIITITNQEKMFTACQKGNLEDLKVCLQNGADINARNMNSWTALHFAARGPSLEVVKFVLDQNLAANVVDRNGQNPLHIAAAHGRKNIVEFFLTKARVPVDVRDNCGKTALHIAAKNGHVDAIEILLKNNSDINIKDIIGYAPLHYAVQNNHIDVVKVLLKKEANVDINETMGGFTCLHIAAEFGCLEIVNFLLENEANVNARHDKEGIPLHPAALNGHLEVVTALILKGADVNARVLDGCTPLHYAVENGHHEVANILLKHGANVNTADKTYYNTPLHYATKDGREEIVEILLKNNANASIATIENMTPLHFAAQSGHLKIVASLLKHGVNVHAKNRNHSTPLHYAAEHGHKEIAELLLQNGADVNAEAINNLTPLHVAALKGHQDFVDILLKYKAGIDRRDIKGNTPLFAAAQNSNNGVIDLLLKNIGGVNVRNCNGQTPLHIAAVEGNVNAIDFLIENKAEVNAADNYGLTPLHGAVMQGHKDVVKLLIKSKAEVNAKGIVGSTPLHAAVRAITPLHMAVEAGHTEIVEILVANGANIDVKSNLIPLLSAVKHNRKEIVEVLIANGADVDVEGGKCLSFAVLAGFKDIVDVLLKNKARIDIKGPHDATLLHLAAKRGNKEVVNALITKGCHVDAVTIDGATPLYLAAAAGHEEVAEILIANKANVNFSNFDGSPLHTAAGLGHDNVVDVLLKNGAKIGVKDGKNRTALELAVARGHLPVVKILLQDKTVNINAKGNDDWTVLHIASQESNLEMVKYLVDQGSNINAKNSSGSKPVHIAAREGFKDTVEFFLSKGLNINELGSNDQTLLFYAVMKNHLEVVKYLIAQGANVNAKDTNGLTAMHFAAILGFKYVIIILLKNGAVYNAVDNLSQRPLDMTNTEDFIAVDKSSQEAVEMAKNKDVTNLLASTEKLFEAVKRNSSSDVENCIKAGAFVNAKNADTETTPLHYAAWKGCDEIVNVLLQNKANPNAVCSKGFTPLHYAAKFSHLGCIKALLYNGAIYNAVSESGKTPLDFTADKSVTGLLKLVDESFRKVKNGNAQIINDLNKIKDGDTLKAVMNACNRENNTLIAAVPQSKSSLVEELKQVAQGDVSAQINEASVLLNQGNYQRALSIFKRLYEKRKQLLGPDNPATLDIQTYVAKALYKQGDYQAALHLLEEIFQKQNEKLGSDNKDSLDTRGTIALVLHRLEKDDEAYDIFQEVYQKQKEILGPNHVNTVNTQFHTALVLERLGKYEEALNNNRAVFEIRKKTLGSGNIATVSAENNIAMVLASKGEYDESLKIYKNVFEKKKKILGINHADTLRTLFVIAGIFFKQNKHQEAVNSYQEVLDLQKKTMPRNHPELLNTQYNLANVLFAQGKWIAALKIYRECYDQRIAIFGPNHSSVLDIARRIEGINLKFKLEGSNESEVAQHLQTDIIMASNNGDVQIVKRLLKGGADVDDKDIDGRTPLHFAVSNGHVVIVNMLLKNGADVTHATNKGNTPLHTATSKGNKEIVDILLQHVSRDKLNDFLNAKTASGGTTSLHVAAKSGSLDVVKSLLQHGATYNITNKEGKTPIDLSKDQKTINLLKLIDDLFTGVKKGGVDVINKLKSLKSDEFLAVTNTRNNHGHGLLQVAIVNKHKNIASALLEMLKKPNPN